MSQVFAPGCALMIYKPELGKRLLDWLGVPEHLTCCRHEPQLPDGDPDRQRVRGLRPALPGTVPGHQHHLPVGGAVRQRPAFPFPDYGGASHVASSTPAPPAPKRGCTMPSAPCWPG
jgi:hypothetical protein